MPVSYVQADAGPIHDIGNLCRDWLEQLTLNGDVLIFQPASIPLGPQQLGTLFRVGSCANAKLPS